MFIIRRENVVPAQFFPVRRLRRDTSLHERLHKSTHNGAHKRSVIMWLIYLLFHFVTVWLKTAAVSLRVVYRVSLFLSFLNL